MSLDPDKVELDDLIEGPELPSRHKRPAPHPTRSAQVNCLRCGKPFVSWDRRRNRLCLGCAKKTY